MALNFNSTPASRKMYTISIEGHEWRLNEANTQKVIDILNGMSSQASSSKKPVDNQLHMEPDKKSRKPLPDGKKIWQESFVTVLQLPDGTIRVYMECPIAGDKGDYIRKRIKDEFKSFGARWSGDFDKNEIHWTFQTEDQAKKYIAARKKAAKERA